MNVARIEGEVGEGKEEAMPFQEGGGRMLR